MIVCGAARERAITSAYSIAELKRREQDNGLASEGKSVAMEGLVGGFLHDSRRLYACNWLRSL